MAEWPSTNPSIFLRLRDDSPTREIAWEQFDRQYRPMIVSFAKRLSMGNTDAEEIGQEVMVGFFSKSPTFVYDSSRGRFRHYLRTCTRHAVQKRFKSRPGPIDNHLDDLQAEQVWEDVWQTESLRLAIDSLRADMMPSNTFLAFERLVMFEQPAQQVSNELGIHLNSVYRARDQVLQKLQVKLRSLKLDLDE
jgi:RNA polymerase sigma factor (sigma-70 family)